MDINIININECIINNNITKNINFNPVIDNYGYIKKNNNEQIITNNIEISNNNQIMAINTKIINNDETLINNDETLINNDETLINNDETFNDNQIMVINTENSNNIEFMSKYYFNNVLFKFENNNYNFNNIELFIKNYNNILYPELNKTNILKDNFDKLDIIYKNDKNIFFIAINTTIIPQSRFIIYNNNLYFDRIPNFEVIENDLKQFIIQENLFKIPVLKTVNLKGNYLNLSSPSNSNYFHFLYDTLSYLFDFLEKTNQLYVNEYNYKILIEHDFGIIKSLFNIDVYYTNNNYYNIEKIILPNIDNNYYFIWNKENINYNRESKKYNINVLIKIREYIFEKFNIKEEKNNFVYLKRQNNLRKIINLDVLEQILSEYNFQFIEPEKKTFIEQVNYFSKIDTLISQGGAGISNLLFMPKNSNIILLVSDSKFVNPHFFSKLCDKLNINVYIIKGVSLYNNNNIYQNNIYYFTKNNISLENHPYNTNIYLNNNNYEEIINLIKKLTGINNNIKYSNQINRKILINNHFYLFNENENKMYYLSKNLLNIILNININNTYFYLQQDKHINTLKIADNIYFIDNYETQHIMSKINFNLLNNNSIPNINFCENFLLLSKKNGNITNYDFSRTECNFKNINNLFPTIDNIDNFFIKNSNKICPNNSIILKKAVFLYSFSSAHYLITHLMFDFTQHINILYEQLINDNELDIILEIIPFTNFTHNKYDITKINNLEITDSLNKFIEFIRDIGLNNKIYIISPFSFYQNFNNDYIFVEKIFYVSLKSIDEIKWVPLISRFCKNNINNYFCDTMKNILKKKNNNINIHYNNYKKRFLILENRNNSSSYSNIRNINEADFNILINICKEYCYKNNLELLIWDNNIHPLKSIYKQFEIINNCEILIGFGGSFFLFNYTMNIGKVLIINILIEYDGIYDSLYNMCFYSLNQTLQNKDINKILLHFYNKDDIFTNSELIHYFLNIF